MVNFNVGLKKYENNYKKLIWKIPPFESISLYCIFTILFSVTAMRNLFTKHSSSLLTPYLPPFLFCFVTQFSTFQQFCYTDNYVYLTNEVEPYTVYTFTKQHCQITLKPTPQLLTQELHK